jgi:thioredoxin-like negative regulator of GroEL
MDQEQIAEMLYNGAVALQEGKRERALNLLMQVVEVDERNEEAWLWLSGAVDDLEDQETALLNVLDINPNNQYAREGLEWIKAHK